jgi:hypothetical protein
MSEMKIHCAFVKGGTRHECRTTFLTLPDVNADLKLLPVPHARIVEITLAHVHRLNSSKHNKTSISASLSYR